MTSVIIMAQGGQRRLPSLKHPKQALLLDESIDRPNTIIDRVVAQCHWRHGTPYLIAGSNLEPRFVCNRFELADPGECILSGILATQLLFGKESTIILLGDVVYSNDAMDKIFACEDPIFVAKTPRLTSSEGEVFALGFKRSHQRIVTEAIRRSPCLDVQGDGCGYVSQPGHMRNLLGSIPFANYCTDLTIDDWTNDIDTEEDLRLLLPQLRQHVVNEANR